MALLCPACQRPASPTAGARPSDCGRFRPQPWLRSRRARRSWRRCIENLLGTRESDGSMRRKLEQDRPLSVTSACHRSNSFSGGEARLTRQLRGLQGRPGVKALAGHRARHNKSSWRNQPRIAGTPQPILNSSRRSRRRASAPAGASAPPWNLPPSRLVRATTQHTIPFQGRIACPGLVSGPPRPSFWCWR